MPSVSGLKTGWLSGMQIASYVLILNSLQLIFAVHNKKTVLL